MQGAGKKPHTGICCGSGYGAKWGVTSAWLQVAGRALVKEKEATRHVGHGSSWAPQVRILQNSVRLSILLWHVQEKLKSKQVGGASPYAGFTPRAPRGVAAVAVAVAVAASGRVILDKNDACSAPPGTGTPMPMRRQKNPPPPVPAVIAVTGEHD